MSTFLNRILPIILTLFFLLLVGTGGYVLIEGWSVLDALYMTVITLATIGFGEVQPLSSAGRIFTMALIFLGIGSAGYSLTRLSEYLLAGNLIAQLRRRRTRMNLQKLQDHVIICGYGRVGQSSAFSLRESKRPMVIIEPNTNRAEMARGDGFWAIEGDGTQDEVLRSAGIDRAWGLIVATGHDGDNLLMVLSARTLNSQLFIVARTTSPDNEPKMRRAGANRVVSPYRMGGRHMANLMVRPHITDFLDVVTLDGGVELWLEELTITPQSKLMGQTVISAQLRRQTGVNLVAMRRGKTGIIIVPDENTLLESHDELIVLGTRDQLAQLEKLTSGK